MKYDFESWKKNYREWFPNMDIEELERQARFMSDKYSTVKEGKDVLHLDYFGNCLTNDDIFQIDSNISKVGLELSHLDKTGIPTACLDDFILHSVICLNESIVSNILIGVAGGALWDSIKYSTFFIWKQIQQRYWSINNPVDKVQKKLNFGLQLRLDSETSFDFKLDGDVDEKTILKALDKVIDLVKETKKKESQGLGTLYIVDKDGDWNEIDIMKEIKKARLKEKNSR